MLETRVDTTQDEGIVEISQELLSDEALDRGSAHGYWKSSGDGTWQRFEPHFFMTSAAPVQVRTSTLGKVNVSLNLYNESGNYPGPTFPQTGGNASLGPGQWRLYFTGSISSYPNASAVNVTVTSSGMADFDVEAEPEAVVEEERGQLFQVRAVGSSRPQAVRIAYRRADQQAGGKPYRVLEERVYPQGSQWVCILRCELT